ncbi:MAG: hypothetical protein K2M76_05025, partial [Muribaculaceae bacterium]|nr:hypothetical protein [Muribaculaceae bacterium]
GFTDDMLIGKYANSLVASKPIMVQPSLPRFLRSGDSAVVKATVMNNTDHASKAVVIVEVFDGISGDVISTSRQECAMDSMASITVTADVAAIPGLTALGYRIKATSGGYTDGEQAVIPVLPSSSQLIETEPFYMAPGDTLLTVKLPKMKRGANVSLEFCENPAWYCVTALPGLRTDDAHTALSASAAIFSAAVASGIMHDQPDVAQAIRYWTQSDGSDSTLVSMLERNPDLKTVLLNSTPWVNTAKADTKRMAQLALLFDSDEISACYDKNIELLSKLEKAGGGWSWTERSERASEWITCRVLGTLGRLQQLGYMPDNAKLGSMVKRAIQYMDNTIGEQYAKYPKGDYTDYTYMRSYFPTIKATGNARKAIDSTVERAGKDWKNQNVAGKAITALLLHRHGKTREAIKVMESLRQYSTSSAERGMWWPSLDSYTGWAVGKVGATSIILDAYATILTGNAAIDKIRQWLILQKEAENWGTSIHTTDPIASILNTGSR